MEVELFKQENTNTFNSDFKQGYKYPEDRRGRRMAFERRWQDKREISRRENVYSHSQSDPKRSRNQESLMSRRIFHSVGLFPEGRSSTADPSVMVSVKYSMALYSAIEWLNSRGEEYAGSSAF
jgi:hypothetical protein